MTGGVEGSPVAVVTGGASGIGLALARALGARGQRVLIADVDESMLMIAASDLRAAGVDAHTCIVDVTDLSAVERLADDAVDLGFVRTACFNAGVSSTGPPVWETPREIFDFVLGVNFFGLVNSLRAFMPKLIDHGQRADVVVTASMAGLATAAFSAAYSASKAAAVALAKALAAELETTASQVHVSLLNPGMVGTNLQRTSAARQPAGLGMTEAVVEESHELLNTLGVSPDQVAEWVMSALDQRRLWVLPPEGDVFCAQLLAELDELRAAIRS